MPTGRNAFALMTCLGLGSVLAVATARAAEAAAPEPPAASAPAAPAGPTLQDLSKLPFFLGREYFVLRSGPVQLLVQADRADLGPAFTWLAFDCRNPRQSASKENAFNFVPGRGHAASALEVVLGGFPFTALGHRTETRWVLDQGVPAAEAVWWAGGIRVTERIAALEGPGDFVRSIVLEGRDIVGEESVTLRLSLPAGPGRRDGSVLSWGGTGARIALAASVPSTSSGAQLILGPLTVPPSGRVAVETLLLVEVPGGDGAALAARAAALLRDLPAARKRTAAAWAAGSSIATEDRTVQGIFEKARFGLPAMVAPDGAMNAGIFEYGAQWVRDTSNTIIGAIHAGHFEVSRTALERMLRTMVTEEGTTMIAGGFDAPDLEQFDQLGELLHCLKAYRDWTGDGSLIREHRRKLLAMVERPLDGRFRDATGMVHNRREFWERSFEDAYELAYQTWVVQGLRDAADLAEELDAADRVQRWRAEADRTLEAMLRHPEMALVKDGHLIKRRNRTGAPAEDPAAFQGSQPDIPLRSERLHRIVPDATQALPIALGLVEGRSDLASRTLADVDALWNARWSDGGHDRYHTSSQPDQPGPWPFATCFILRGQHEAGLFDRSRRSLEWLDTVQGGRTGAWFEEIPSARSTIRGCGILPWTSGEIALFVVRHWLGVRFEGAVPVIRPALYPGSPRVQADLRFRKGRLRIEVDGSGPIEEAAVDGAALRPGPDGALRLSPDWPGGTVTIRARKVN